MPKCPEWLERHIKNTEDFIEQMSNNLEEMRRMRKAYMKGEEPIRQFTCNICGDITQITDYDNPNHYTSLEEDKLCELCFKLFPKELINRLRNK